MTKQAFRAEGDFQMGRIRQHFNIEVIGEDDAAAREAVYADLGSRHSVPRRVVEITTITPMKKEDANPVIQKMLE